MKRAVSAGGIFVKRENDEEEYGWFGDDEATKKMAFKKRNRIFKSPQKGYN